MLYQTYLTATFEDSFLIEADSPEDAKSMAEELFLTTTAIICEGDTYESATAHGVMIRKRPEVQMLSDAMRHAHALLGELMITPSTALRLGEGQKKEDNPFAALLEL
jgi:hypothetical protein